MESDAMRAVRYASYGSAEQLAIEVTETPRPGRHEVQVRVSRAALNPKDVLLRSGKFSALSGRQFPKQTGLDLAGVVIASRHPDYQVGQRVFGFLNEWTGKRGTLAEVVCASAQELAHLPASVSAEQGAAVALVGTTCLQALRDIGQIAAGSELLIHGASGGVGSMAIQIARLLGARVTTLSSAENRGLCERLGAADARAYEPVERMPELSTFDCVFDVYGSLSATALRPRLKRGATLISTVPTVSRLLRNVLTRGTKVRERVVMVRARTRDLEQLAHWLEAGLLEAVVDTRFALDDVHSAFAQLESRHCRGKVIIELGAES
jgi:NADPH:quinone reductase-like Zn-dependent oxidoreductase